MCDTFETSEEEIWHNVSESYLEKETLIISMFHIDPMLTKEEITTETERVFKDVNVRFRPWIEHYIWNESPVKFKITETNGFTYIYGEMVFGDYFDDEWLVTQILFELSKTYKDLYIHLADNEGEFLLIEGAHHLPEWIQPENSRNRDWINNGRILLVPEEYYKDRGLKMNEALKFLERAVYKCLKIEEIDKLIISKLNKYPTKTLQGQTEMEIITPRGVAGILMKNKILNQALLSYGKEITPKREERHKNDDLVELKVRTTALAVLFTDFYLKSQGLENAKVNSGELVSQAVSLYTKEHDIDTSYIPTDEEIKSFNQQGDVLQKELIRLMRIDKYVPSNINLEDMNEQPQNDNDIISKLEDFFKDTNAGLDGVENGPEQVNGEINAKLEEIESESEPDTEDEDEKAREYLAKENIDIDEDDFFEFFAKEALKLSDEDIEKFRKVKLDDAEKDKKQPKEEDEYEYESDDEEEELLEQFASGGMEKSLQELLKSLETEGGIDGPAATLLQSMGISIPNQK